MTVATVCRKLAMHGLVVMSQGNASARSPYNDFLIKASGVVCSKAHGADIVVVSLPDGSYKADGKKPSTDAEAHRYLYNHLHTMGGIVHTHSPWATAWATAGIAIPCCTTAQSDWFGGDIPCGAYCPIGTEDIGREIERLYQIDSRRRAFLIRQHGVFCIGKTVDEALQAAVMTESFAQVTWLAQHLAGLKLIPADEMKANYERYHASYGQP